MRTNPPNKNTEPNPRKRTLNDADKDKDKPPKKDGRTRNTKSIQPPKKTTGNSDSEGETSEPDDPNSNWAITLPYWPVETRKPMMQRKDVVNAMNRDHLFKLMELDQNQLKQEKAENMEIFRNDDTIPVTRYKAGKDDRKKRFHPASFERLPVCDQSVYWDQMPIKRPNVYRNIQLAPTGSQHNISDKAIEFLHNRTALISLKLFLPENINVTSRPMREVKRFEDQGLCTVTELAWENATSISQIKEALINYGICLQQLWPGDSSAWSLLRLLEKYKYCVNVQPNKTRVLIITNLFNKVARENASLAANREPPLVFDKLELILKASLTRNGQSCEVPATERAFDSGNNGNRNNYNASSSSNGASNYQRNNGSTADGRLTNPRQSRDSRPPSFQSSRPPPPMSGGLKLCYGFNSTDGSNCMYAQTPNGGCVNARGTKFAHVCSKFIESQQKYCLQKHRRVFHK